MWGRVDATGKMQFQADNGCVSTGLLEPGMGLTWSGRVNIEGCKESDMNGRYTAYVRGGEGQQALSMKFSTSRQSGGKTDGYEVSGTFTRYRA
jgi:hypothetical protein